MKARIAGIVAACAAAGVLASAGTWVLLSGGGGDGTAAPSAAVASAKEDAAPDGTLRGGIGVRGHWVIEVRDPDGTLARREEFDNMLVVEGRALLELLSDSRRLYSWEVSSDGTGGERMVLAEPGMIVDPSYVVPIATSSNLVVTWVKEPSHLLRLTGSVVTPQDQKLLGVRTDLVLCPDANKCPGTSINDRLERELTLHQLPQIPVVAGQQILVTVEISFQSA